MLCPNCKKETLSILDYCSNCNYDLREIQNLHEENLIIGGKRKILIISFISMIGLFLFNIFLFGSLLFGYIFINGVIYFIAPAALIFNMGAFFGALFSKKTWKKKNKIN